jgi:hypothetical protein
MSTVQQPSLEEPRSVVQQLVTKFQADCDIDSIDRINEAFLAIQEHRAQKLSSSRDLLHRTICTFSLFLSLSFL